MIDYIVQYWPCRQQSALYLGGTVFLWSIEKSFMAWTFTFPLDDQAWFRFSSKRFPCHYSRASDRQVAISLSRSKYQKDKNEADEKKFQMLFEQNIASNVTRNVLYSTPKHSEQLLGTYGNLLNLKKHEIFDFKKTS